MTTKIKATAVCDFCQNESKGIVNYSTILGMYIETPESWTKIDDNDWCRKCDPRGSEANEKVRI